MRRAMMLSSASANGISAAGSAGSRPSSSRRRSTARPSRMLSAPITVPIAVSRNTGAMASWITPAISGMCVSAATPQSTKRPRLWGARVGRRPGARAALLLLGLRLLLRRRAGPFVLAAEGRRGAYGHEAGDDQLAVDVALGDEVEH